MTCVHSYVSAAKSKTFCIYDTPAPQAIWQVASRNQLAVGNITEVSILDPYFYHCDGAAGRGLAVEASANIF